MPRLPAVTEIPQGLVYRAGCLTADEEHHAIGVCETLDFAEVRMKGQTAHRTVAHYGYRYEYESWRLVPADPLPESLEWLRERAARVAGVDPASLAEALVTRYPPGAGIGWHRDAPMFGPTVVGVSLLSPCTMRFQRRLPDMRKTYALVLEPRSAYVLSGEVRSQWQHSIPSAKALRYSVTFRTLRRSKGR